MFKSVNKIPSSSKSGWNMDSLLVTSETSSLNPIQVFLLHFCCICRGKKIKNRSAETIWSLSEQPSDASFTIQDCQATNQPKHVQYYKTHMKSSRVSTSQIQNALGIRPRIEIAIWFNLVDVKIPIAFTKFLLVRFSQILQILPFEYIRYYEMCLLRRFR